MEVRAVVTVVVVIVVVAARSSERPSAMMRSASAISMPFRSGLKSGSSVDQLSLNRVRIVFGLGSGVRLGTGSGFDLQVGLKFDLWGRSFLGTLPAFAVATGLG